MARADDFLLEVATAQTSQVWIFDCSCSRQMSARPPRRGYQRVPKVFRRQLHWRLANETSRQRAPVPPLSGSRPVSTRRHSTPPAHPSSSGSKAAEGWATVPGWANFHPPRGCTITAFPGRTRGRCRPPGDPQESFRDAGDHQADGVHVRGYHYGGARSWSSAMPQSVQRAQFAAADFMHERPPFSSIILEAGSS